MPRGQPGRVKIADELTSRGMYIDYGALPALDLQTVKATAFEPPVRVST